MPDRKLQQARNIAKRLGIKGIITESKINNKRFTITRPYGKIIHFGLWPFSGHGTFIDHKDEKIKKAWQARHQKILKSGKPAYKNKDSPEYYSWNILW